MTIRGHNIDRRITNDVIRLLCKNRLSENEKEALNI